MQHEKLTYEIIGCAMKVHSTLGPGFLESVYQNALAFELQRSGVAVEVERPLRVTYEGVVVGSFCVDMLVDDVIVVENKAVRALTSAHEVQLVNYLAATGLDTGLLLNFGAQSLQYKRKYRTYRPPEAESPDPHPVNPVNPV